MSYPKVTDQLVASLQAKGIDFSLTEHAPVRTSTEAAEIRGTTLHSGAKALILKAGESFRMVVLPADLALDSAAARKVLGCKQLRFANKDELWELTGLEPGSVPPFGSLFELETTCDDRLAENEKVNFNAGSRSISIQMSYEAYIAFESPNICRIAKPAKPNAS